MQKNAKVVFSMKGIPHSTMQRFIDRSIDHSISEIKKDQIKDNVNSLKQLRLKIKAYFNCIKLLITSPINH